MQPFSIELNSYAFRDKLFSNIDKKRKLRKQCDSIIKVDNEEFYCHHKILTSISSYFRCLEKYDLVRQSQNDIAKVEIKGVDSYSMGIIMDYIYTGEIIVESNHLPCLIIAADYLVMDSMLESISEILCYFFSVDNVLDYYYLGKTINSISIKRTAFNFMVRSIYALLELDKIKYIDFCEIRSIINDNRLIIKSKNFIFFGSLYEKVLKMIVEKWLSSAEESEEQLENFKGILNNDIKNNIGNCLHGNFTSRNSIYHYIEPISRAYYMNASPYGKHPPFLVSHPYNFRCISRNIKRTFLDFPPHKWFIKRIILYIIRDKNGVQFLSDVDIEYEHYWSGERNLYSSNTDKSTNCERIEIDLKNDERIVKMYVHHSWLIYGIVFITTQNRQFGVYGTTLGNVSCIDFYKDYPHSLYLHGFAFLSTSSRGWRAINWMTVYGAMLDKEAYLSDFGVPFETEYENAGGVTNVLYEALEENRTMLSKFSVADERNGDSSVTLQDVENLEGFKGQELHHPLPHTIDDLFYQWRRCMRLMRLSVVRRQDSVFSVGLTPQE